MGPVIIERDWWDDLPIPFFHSTGILWLKEVNRVALSSFFSPATGPSTPVKAPPPPFHLPFYQGFQLIQSQEDGIQWKRLLYPKEGKNYGYV